MPDKQPGTNSDYLRSHLSTCHIQRKHNILEKIGGAGENQYLYYCALKVPKQFYVLVYNFLKLLFRHLLPKLSIIHMAVAPNPMLKFLSTLKSLLQNPSSHCFEREKINQAIIYKLI